MQDEIAIPHLIYLQSQLTMRLRQQFGDPSIDPIAKSGSVPLPPGLLDAQRGLALDLEQLPYSLDAAFSALQELARRQAEVLRVESERQTALPVGGVRLLHPSERNPMAFAVDAYLDAAVRAQNAASAYVNRALDLKRKRLPTSMHDVAIGLRNGKFDLPPLFAELYRRYWDDGFGRRNKEYRDLAQHFTVVSSDGRVMRPDNGSPAIYLVLPNNPEEKSPVKLVYRNPTVHAYVYVLSSFLALYGFVYELALHLARDTGPATILTGSWNIKTGLQVPTDNAECHGAPVPEQWVQEMARMRQEIDARLGTV